MRVATCTLAIAVLACSGIDADRAEQSIAELVAARWNYGQVGRFARFAQPRNSTQLAVICDRCDVVVNLRGKRPDDSAWREEVAALEECGVELVNVAWTVAHVPSRAEFLAAMIPILRAPPGERVCWHCRAGADRSCVPHALALRWQLGVFDAQTAVRVACTSPNEAVEHGLRWWGHDPGKWGWMRLVAGELESLDLYDPCDRRWAEWTHPSCSGAEALMIEESRF